MHHAQLLILLGCYFGFGDAIIGGTETCIGEFPWMTLLEYTKRDGTKNFLSAGVLINKDYVLTAASNVNSRGLERTQRTLTGVQLGDWDLRTERDCADEEDSFCSDPALNIRVAEVIIHPNYTQNSKANNIALIRLERSVQFTKWVHPIRLPDTSITNVTNMSFIAAGWGRTEIGNTDDVSRKVTLNGWSFDECARIYSRHRVDLSEDHLCAGGENGKDTCTGDTGGPLMAVGNSDQSKGPPYYLAGLITFGPSNCGTAGFPGVSTRIDKHIKWISDISHYQALDHSIVPYRLSDKGFNFMNCYQENSLRKKIGGKLLILT